MTVSPSDNLLRGMIVVAAIVTLPLVSGLASAHLTVGADPSSCPDDGRIHVHIGYDPVSDCESHPSVGYLVRKYVCPNVCNEQTGSPM